MWCLCYKTKEPVVYNKGTGYETSCDHFLLGYIGYDEEHAQKVCDDLMRHKNATTSSGITIPWDEIDYLYIHEQEEFDTRWD